MAGNVKFSKDELNKLLEDPNSCVTLTRSTYNLALYPYHLNDYTSSIKELLNAKVAKYMKSLDGVLLGYRNVKLLTNQGAIVADSCYIHVNIEADFYIFKPELNSTLTGIVNKKSKGHVGCLVHRIFNVSVPKLEDDEEWLGYLTEIGDEVLLKISYVNLEARLPYIRATLILTESLTTKLQNRATENNDEEVFEMSPKEKKKHKNKSVENIEENFHNESSTEVISKKKKHKTKRHEIEESYTVIEEHMEEGTYSKKKKRKSSSSISEADISAEISEKKKKNKVNRQLQHEKDNSNEIYETNENLSQSRKNVYPEEENKKTEHSKSKEKKKKEGIEELQNSLIMENSFIAKKKEHKSKREKTVTFEGSKSFDEKINAKSDVDIENIKIKKKRRHSIALDENLSYLQDSLDTSTISKKEKKDRKNRSIDDTLLNHTDVTNSNDLVERKSKKHHANKSFEYNESDKNEKSQKNNENGLIHNESSENIRILASSTPLVTKSDHKNKKTHKNISAQNLSYGNELDPQDTEESSHVKKEKKKKHRDVDISLENSVDNVDNEIPEKAKKKKKRKRSISLEPNEDYHKHKKSKKM